MMINDSDKRTADRTVSATYRELADERAPANLDEKILRAAAAPPRARFGIGRAWMKPVAWAATIGLSLAIVLELTQIPPAPPAIDTPAIDTPAIDTPAIDTVEPPPAAELPASAPVSSEPATAKENLGNKPSRHRSEPGAVQKYREPTMAPAAHAGSMMLEQPALCPDAVRAVAEDWYQCIEAHRNKVSAQRIAREIEELRSRFPDFPLSDTE